MSNTPQVRFAGFTGDWEQRKFGDFTFPAGERNKDDLDLEPFAITNNQGFIAQSEAHDDFGYMKNVDRKMYIVVKPNSFAYNPARINVGSLGYYEGTENVIVSSLYEVFQTAEYVDDKFLNHWFKTKAFQDWIERLQEGSVRLYFYYDKLCECIMSMPSVEEQRKIGPYLDKIDNLIALQQRKCDALQKFKKSMLQKMFPQNGESVPEIRFAGFTDAWKQRMLGEFADIVTGKLDANAMKEDGEYDFYTSGIQKYKIDVPAFEGPAITIAGNGATVGYMHLADGKFNAYQRTYVLSAFQASREFLFYEIGNKLPKKIAQEARTGNIPYIVMDMLTDLQISIPSEQEQSKVGEFMMNLDTLITLHQRKLETLQKMKKSLLQKMFPPAGRAGV